MTKAGAEPWKLGNSLGISAYRVFSPHLLTVAMCKFINNNFSGYQKKDDQNSVGPTQITSPVLFLCKFASQLQTLLRHITNLALRNTSDFLFALIISLNES